ncbi:MULTISPECIES: ABC transporter substrate-binding protein [unclassified Microbacterium]|uniref:ABC transporter substrate-binding protein n=1 Tax=unclassified Microbacterium TaxID=2609290 RepID=UPI0036661DDC
MNRRSIAALAAAAIAAVALSGCSTAGSNTTTTSTPASGPVEITVGVGNEMAVLPLGKETFSSDRIKIIQKVSAPGGVTALLLNGQAQLATTDPASALIAISKGVPIQIVATSMTSGTNADDDLTGLLVKADGGPADVKALSGQTIAVTKLGGGAQIGAQAGIDQMGGDSKSVKFVELPPANLIPAVQNGTVAAAVTQEPAVTRAKQSGLKSLFAPAVANAASAPVNVYIATKEYVAGHKDVIDAFIKDLGTASKKVTSNTDQTRAALAKLGNLSDQEAKSMVLPIYVPNAVDVSKIKEIEQGMIKYGALNKELDLSTAVYSG